jgi:hypothetical protein
LILNYSTLLFAFTLVILVYTVDKIRTIFVNYARYIDHEAKRNYLKDCGITIPRCDIYDNEEEFTM